MEHTKALLKAIFEMATTHKAFGDLFASIGAREQQVKASEAFSKFGEAHRQIDKFAHGLLKTIKPVSSIISSQIQRLATIVSTIWLTLFVLHLLDD